MTERIHGPVQSPITDLLQSFEVSMWAEGLAPEATVRVLNRVTFGRPDPGQHGSVTGIPEWADNAARMYLAQIQGELAESPGPEDDSPGQDLRLVVLAMVQRTLQEHSAAERALSE